MGDLHRNCKRVVAAAEERGVDVVVRQFPQGTRTAADAADAIGCDVAAICKSIVVMADDEAVVVLTSGVNRVDMDKVGNQLGAGDVRRATADEVKLATGQPIGGTAPFGHPDELALLMDETLFHLDQIWAAAGTPDTVFAIAPGQLSAATGAQTANIAAGG